MTERQTFVVEKYGWYYVVDGRGVEVGEYAGPWRYRADAQKHCDELNGADCERLDQK